MASCRLMATVCGLVCLKTVKESALKIPDARVYCGFLEVYVEGMTRVRLERARARRVRPDPRVGPRETRGNVLPANVFSAIDPPPPPPTPPRGSIFSGITAPLYIIVPLCGKFVGSHTPFEVYI